MEIEQGESLTYTLFPQVQTSELFVGV